MTEIFVDTAVVGNETYPVIGTITLTYWAGSLPEIHVEGDTVVFAEPVIFESGDSAEPTGEHRCARWIVETEAGKLTRYTEIPDVEWVDFADLVDVNPFAFTPYPEQPTLIEYINDNLVPGPQGPQGAQGPQGLPGVNGEQGPAGVAGIPGPVGPRGLTGPQGIQGPAGVQGPMGPTGPTGADSTVPGPQGPAGATGATGPQGPAGVDGVDGADGADSTVPGPQGVQGLQGPTGPKGDPGVKGDKGATGPQGIQGNPGPKGDDGAPGPAGADSTVPGPAGPAGADGATGPAGEPGPAGEDGRGLNWLGDWDLGYAYEVQDAVTRFGSSYVCTLAHTSTVGNAPPAGVPTGYWDVLAVAGDQGPAGAQGVPGSTGASAYEIALNTGFTGTEEEWLESLHGEDGEGFNQMGAWSGSTPYNYLDVVTYNGKVWLSNSDGDWTSSTPPSESNLNWTLLTIVGPQGPAGADGTDGADGATGPKGDKGDTGAAGPAGPAGEDGATGATGPAGEIGPAGPKGDKGDKGDTGDTGATGSTGATGPAGESITVTLVPASSWPPASDSNPLHWYVKTP